jgi:hypothetical protein
MSGTERLYPGERPDSQTLKVRSLGNGVLRRIQARCTTAQPRKMDRRFRCPVEQLSQAGQDCRCLAPYRMRVAGQVLYTHLQGEPHSRIER